MARIGGQKNEGYVDGNSRKQQTDVLDSKSACSNFGRNVHFLLLPGYGWAAEQARAEQEKGRAHPAKNREHRPPAIPFHEHGRYRRRYQGSATDAADGNPQRDIAAHLEPFANCRNRRDIGTGHRPTQTNSIGQKQKWKTVHMRCKDHSAPEQQSSGSHHRTRSIAVSDLPRQRGREKGQYCNR